MRNYLENQRELINTHKQYLELNSVYQNNITIYINRLLRDNDTLSHDEHINTNDETMSSTTYNISDSVNSDISNNVNNNEIVNDTNDLENSNLDNSQANLRQTPFEQIIQEHNHNMQLINDSRERRRRFRRRQLPHLNVDTRNGQTNRQHLISNNENNYNNMSVPVSIVNQECDISPYNTINTTQDMCPIDRVPFEENENVMRIRFCGHIFRENNLRENFRSRATCPVCRHNIITTVTNVNYQRNVSPDNIESFIRY